jgi:hypothetical protein
MNTTPNHMHTNDRRVTYADIPADLIPDQRSEELRLASFRYSETVMAGQRCDFRQMQCQHNEIEQ